MTKPIDLLKEFVLASVGDIAVLTRAGFPPDELRFTLQYDRAPNIGEETDKIAELLGSNYFVLATFADASDLDHFLVLRFPGIERTLSVRLLFEIGYALCDALQLVSADPDIGTRFFSEPSPGSTASNLESAEVIGPLCWVTTPAPVDRRWALGAANILEAWKSSRGEGILVAQPDSGIAEHVELDQSDARSTAMTLLSDEPFFRWIPDDEDEIARNFGNDGHSIQPWITETPNTQRQLDRHDPYGSTSALERPFPSDFTQKVLNVMPSDVVTRRWSSDVAPQFYAEAWGAEGGRGEHAWSETGSRILVSTSALKSLLEATDRYLVILVKIQKHHRGKSSGRGGDTSAFTHRSLIVVSNSRGEVWLPQRLSNKAKLALNTLDADRRRGFYARFRAIAGLPDEWLAQRNDPPVDAERLRIFLEELSAGEASQH